jgi:hypothetical protein
MKGGLIQLASFGSEDLNLISNKEITYFKYVYKRHTPLAIESIEKVFVNKPRFGGTCTVKIPKDGDIISRMYLTIDLPFDSSLTSSYWVNRIGFRLIKKVELYIGNQLIDRLFGQWMHVWSELTHSIDKKNILDKLVGSKDIDGLTNGNKVSVKHTLNIPLNFFFCNNYESALPIIAIREKDVYLKFFFETKKNCIQSGDIPTGDLSNASLWIDYIFLDTEEKMDMVQNKLEYVIEVIKHYERNLLSNNNKSILLPFNLSCKELFWTIRKNTNLNDLFTDFTTDDYTVQLKVKGKNIFSSRARNNNYFDSILPYQYHTGCPDKGINCYPFCLKPESHEMSGLFNFRNIDKFTFNLTNNKNSFINIYAKCYNVLIIDKGNVDLVYKN